MVPHNEARAEAVVCSPRAYVHITSRTCTLLLEEAPLSRKDAWLCRHSKSSFMAPSQRGLRWAHGLVVPGCPHRTMMIDV